jgi:hypothetical protein
MDGIDLGGIAADPVNLADAAENLAMLATAAWLASEGNASLGGHSDTSDEALSHLLQRVRDDAEALAAMAGNRSPRWLVQS